ncbi:Asp domain-containing protein, partial [Cephalotus follicularis]
MMASFSYAPSIIISVILCLFIISVVEADKKMNGFSVELIHRDSPKSPFYNPSETPWQRLADAIRRSNNRVNRFNSIASASNDTMEAPIVSDDGSYIMKIGAGTPVFEFFAIADTGSDLVWIQCQPCVSCYPQNGPIFNPASSSTYQNVFCNSTQCQYLPEYSCGDNSLCQYTYGYGDGSYTVGDLGTETYTLKDTSGDPVLFTGTVMGCGFNNTGTFSPNGTGLIGLGGGPLSFISQGVSEINGTFSYCLAPDGYSTINFGNNAVSSGTDTVVTPYSPTNGGTFYTLTLETITVGSTTISNNVSSGPNIIIDSGTTLTYIPTALYNQVQQAVTNQINAPVITDPTGNGFQPCYNYNGFQFPGFTVGFTNADVVLGPSNFFAEVASGVVCFFFQPSDGLSIFGNLSQMDMVVGYNTLASTVSFTPAHCTQQ